MYYLKRRIQVRLYGSVKEGGKTNLSRSVLFLKCADKTVESEL